MAARRTVKQEVAELGEFCKEHFPHGFPQWAKELNQSAVACEHGQYPADSKVPAAEPEKTAEPLEQEPAVEDDEAQHEA